MSSTAWLKFSCLIRWPRYPCGHYSMTSAEKLVVPIAMSVIYKMSITGSTTILKMVMIMGYYCSSSTLLYAPSEMRYSLGTRAKLIAWAITGAICCSFASKLEQWWHSGTGPVCREESRTYSKIGKWSEEHYFSHWAWYLYWFRFTPLVT